MTEFDLDELLKKVTSEKIPTDGGREEAKTAVDNMKKKYTETQREIEQALENGDYTKNPVYYDTLSYDNELSKDKIIELKNKPERCM